MAFDSNAMAELMSATEITDAEFERCLELVRDLWEAGRDTVEIAAACGILECQSAHIVECIVEANADERYEQQKEEAISGLASYFGASDWADVVVFGKVRRAKTSHKLEAHKERQRRVAERIRSAQP